MSVAAFYGLPHAPITPLVLTVLSERTILGTRYYIAGRDERGEWQPEHRDPLGRVVRYCLREYAVRELTRLRRRYETQGIEVDVMLSAE